MTTVNITEENFTKYLIVTQQKDPSTLITTRIAITDNFNNSIKLVDIQRGPEGQIGPQGPQGPPGQNGVSFSVLPINSGGTNNTIFTNDKIIYYDGNKLSSTNYSINDLLSASNNNAITGIIPGTGLSKISNGSTVAINTNLGEGLSIDNNNNIIVDDSIARRVELTVGNISGILGINKGGTNNSFFNNNRLIYFDGNKLTSFPLDTGRILTSGTSINIVAGSGLTGGGSLSIPSGSVVIGIDPSQDIFVTENSLELSTTGTPGTYTKVTTDTKGRVVSGSFLTKQDILNILGYTPWNPDNDGQNSGLDADLLDGKDGSYYLNFSNFTGTVQNDILPIVGSPGTYSKVTTDNKGRVVNGENINYADTVSALGYRPVSTSGDTIYGDLNIVGNTNLEAGSVTIEDNLPIIAFDNQSLLPNDPRGISFEYGNVFKQTGILAYYPADDRLKLTTKIYGSGDNSSESIILSQEMADQKYISLSSNQTVSGIKSFIDPVNVSNYINISQGSGYTSSPIFIGQNSGLVSSLNADLLDDKHGSFYRDAKNLTGTLNYTTVSITNISGTNNYVPIFDNRTSGPSRTISDSIIRQSGESDIFIDEGSLSVGYNNKTDPSSLSIGTNNIVSGYNSSAIGYGNTINSDNSLAINLGSSTDSDNSLAMGSYGSTWMNNQLSIGAFKEVSPIDNKSKIGLGQRSLSAIGYNGVTNGSYSSLTPYITIPNNKTILYNIDLLFSKLGGSGGAVFSFTSGIVKNINGSTRILQNHIKSQLYNDSQIRDYLYTIKVEPNYTQTQILSVKNSPLTNNNLDIYNLPNIIRIQPELTEISGYFDKTFDGRTIIKMEKPVSSGWFEQSEDSYLIKVKSYNNGSVTGCILNTEFTSGVFCTPMNTIYDVKSISNKDELYISDYFWIGYYTSGDIDIPFSSITGIDFINSVSFSGNFANTSNTVSNCSIDLNGKVFSGMPLSIANGFNSTPIVVSAIGNTLVLDTPYSGSNTNQPIVFNQYSYHRFNLSKSIYIDDNINNYNLALDKIGNVSNTASGIKISISGYQGPSVVSPILISPTINNSGYLRCIHKRSHNGRFTRSSASFKKYDVNYIQYPSVSGYGLIDIQGSENIQYAPSYNPYIKFLTATNSFSGVLTSGSNIITNCTPPQTGYIVSGMILSCNISGFPENNTVSITPTGDSIEMNSIYSGIGTGVLLIYSGQLPPETNYYKTQNLYGGSGLQVERLYGNETGIYVTGQATLYTNYGYAQIQISLFKDVNLSDNEISYLNFISNSNGLMPVSTNYLISGVSTSNFTVTSRHLMPDSGIYSTGLVLATFNKDHGYLPPQSLPSYVQQIPVIFSLPTQYVAASSTALQPHTGLNPSNRKPKDNLLDILAVTGDYILVSDNKNYLLKETNTVPYYDIYQTSPFIKDDINNTLKINFSKNYLQLNDQIYCTFNNNILGQNQHFRITGIDTNNGNYYIRPVSGCVTGIVPLSGSLSFIGSTSGYIYSPMNNVFLNSYGGRTESWGRDIDGKYVDPPLTGFFQVYNSPKLCNSGTLCVHISGVNDLSSIVSGQKLYLDFVDMENQSLVGYFSVYDKITANIFTINIPYNGNYINQSGTVYLIDGSENIKTHKNPNYNNSFIDSTIYTANNSIYPYKLSSFNDENNRWKNMLSLKNTLSPNRYIENITVVTDGVSKAAQTKILVLTPEDLSFSIQYSIDKTVFNTISNNINISKGQELTLKIIVKNGAGYWSTNVEESAPIINILGLSDYIIGEDDKTYNSLLKQWEITVNCGVINNILINKPIKITVSDESGRVTKDILLSASDPLSITSIDNTEYGYAGGGQYWRLLFEAYGGNLSDAQQPTVAIINQGYPEFETVYSTVEYLEYPSGWYGVVIQGTPGSTTGVFNPVFSIYDGVSTIQRTGTLVVRPGAGPIKPYSLSARTLNSNISSKYLNNQFSDLGFIVPVNTNIDANFNVVLTNVSSLTINNPVIEYNPNLKVYTYRANISGSPGYYTPQINISVSQPSGNSYASYSLSTGVGFTIYNDMFIDATELVQPLIFDLNKEWSFDFYIKEGASAHRPDIAPKVYFGNTPNIGQYNNNSTPKEYNIGYTYNNNNKYWKISATGKRDLFGEAARATGLYPIYIYAEDYSSSITGTIFTKITQEPSLKNIEAKKYSTPNNGFEFNVDIAGTGYGAAPPLSIPDSLKDALISPNRTYYKYDPNTKIWEATYKCAPLTEKWDSSVNLEGNTLYVRAKGILDDKLYVAGKVDMVEVENGLTTVFKPLNIKNVVPEYQVSEGGIWEISFTTEGGLEDSKYAPEIQLSSLPTPCSGFDPRIPDAQNNSCFISKTWKPGTKEWDYVFRGTPLCLNQGEFNVSIFARDRIGDTTYGSDSANTKITYVTIGEQPYPSIENIGDTSLYPNCQYYQSNQLKYKVNIRSTCPRPTGITGLIMWGSLPSGITVTDSRAGTFSSPYNDLTGGYVTFQGYPTAFANGGAYAEKFNIAVIDARGKSGVVNNISFYDASQPIETSPTDMTIYFNKPGYTYTPDSGTSLITDEGQVMIRPPANPFSMQCLSVLPHNKCAYSTGLYTILDSNTIKLSGIGTILNTSSYRQLYNNYRTYIEFDNQISSSFNKEYNITRIDNDTISITSSGHNINPSTSGLAKILKTEGNFKNMSVNGAVYGGSPTVTVVDTTTTGIMGGGEFKTINGYRGFVGRIKPTLSASLASGINRSNSTLFEDFTISPIPNENEGVFAIKFINCYETGYLRVSGIVLPSPSLDSTDPPPGGSNLYTTNNGGAIAIAIRTAYGSGENQKNNPINARSLGNINYQIYDISSNISYSSGSLSTNGLGVGTFSFVPPSVSSGAIFALYLQYLSSQQFPTYNKFAIGSLNNIYYWSHKAGSYSSVPAQNSFPAVLPLTNKNLLFTSGINPNSTIEFMGGYIPITDLSFPYGNWSYSEKVPHVTGFIQKSIPEAKLTGYYIQNTNSSDLNITLSNNNIFASGNAATINFKPYTNNVSLGLSNTGLILTNITGNNILLTNANTYPNTRSGIVELYDAFNITSGNNPYEVKILHRSGVANELSVNKSIDLINLNSPTQSVQGNIFPLDYKLSIISGTSQYSFAAVGSFVFSGTLTSGSNIITNCSYSPLNILKSGVSLYSPTHELPQDHTISSVSSNTITLSSAYSGVSSDNVLIYYSGYALSGYYSNMLNTSGYGLCELRQNIYNSDNSQILSFSPYNEVFSNSKTTFNITGIPNNPGFYKYRIYTSENSGLPLFTGSPYWEPKKYSKDYPLTICSPISIVAPSATVSLVNNSWSYSFAITGGYMPRADKYVEIELNGYIHTFSRSQSIVSDSGMLVTLTSKPGFNWSGIFQQPVSIKVYDDIGYDLKYINAVY